MDFKMLTEVKMTRIRHSRIGSGTETTQQAQLTKLIVLPELNTLWLYTVP